MRVTILSAPVGAGHDVAARRVAAELAAGGATVEVVDGLRLIGPRLERAVINGYRFQLRRAAWSWKLTYAVSRSQLVMRVVGSILSRVARRRLEGHLRAAAPDLVVSTYPLVSAALASMRRGRRLPMPAVTMITDFDAHAAWVHPDLDANCSIAGTCTGVLGVRPPVAECALADGSGVRERLGVDEHERLVLVVGGAWGVGAMHQAALAVEATRGARAVVVTGHNDGLRRQMLEDARLKRTVVLGYRDDLLDLIAASDVVIQHAGGVTCLEAFALAVPVVMFSPVLGHGAANAACMQRAGVATTIEHRHELTALLDDTTFWSDVAPALVSRSATLLDQPTLPELIAALPADGAARRMRRRPMRSVVAVTLALGALVALEDVADAAVRVARHLIP